MNMSLNDYLKRKEALSHKFNIVCYNYLKDFSNKDELYAYCEYIDNFKKELTQFCNDNKIAIFQRYFIDASDIMRHCTERSYDESLDYVLENDVDKEYDFDNEVSKFVASKVATENKTEEVEVKTEPVVEETKKEENASEEPKKEETKPVEEEKKSETVLSGASDDSSSSSEATADDEKEDKTVDAPTDKATDDFESMGIPLVDLDEEESKKNPSDEAGALKYLDERIKECENFINVLMDKRKNDPSIRAESGTIRFLGNFDEVAKLYTLDKEKNVSIASLGELEDMLNSAKNWDLTPGKHILYFKTNGSQTNKYGKSFNNYEVVEGVIDDNGLVDGQPAKKLVDEFISSFDRYYLQVSKESEMRILDSISLAKQFKDNPNYCPIDVSLITDENEKEIANKINKQYKDIYSVLSKLGLDFENAVDKSNEINEILDKLKKFKIIEDFNREKETSLNSNILKDYIRFVGLGHQLKALRTTLYDRIHEFERDAERDSRAAVINQSNEELNESNKSMCGLIDEFLKEVENKFDSIESLKKFGDPIKGFNKEYSQEYVIDLFNNDPDAFSIIKDDIKKQIISDALLSASEFDKVPYHETIKNLHNFAHNIINDYGGDFKYYPEEFKNLDSMTYDQFVKFCEAFKYDVSKLPNAEPLKAEDIKTEEKATSKKVDEEDKGEKVGKITGIKKGKVARYEECSKHVNNLIALVKECAGVEFGTTQFDEAFNKIINGDIEKYDAEIVNKIIDEVDYINEFLEDNKVSYKGERIEEIDTLNASNSLTNISFGLNESKDKGLKVTSMITSYAIPVLASIALKAAPTGLSAVALAGGYLAEKGFKTVVEKNEKKDGKSAKRKASWAKLAMNASNAIKNAGKFGLISKFSLPVIGALAAGSLLTNRVANYKLANLDPEKEKNYNKDRYTISEHGLLTSIKQNVGIYFKDPEKLKKLKSNAMSMLITSGLCATTSVIKNFAVNDETVSMSR